MKKMSSSFCMCFDPLVSENGLMVGEGSKSSLSEVKPLLSPAENMMGSDDKEKDVVGSFGRKNKPGRRSLSRYVKAVFFETSLMKKMRSKKLGQKLYRIYSGNKFKSKSKSKSKCKSELKSKKIFNSMINNAPCEDIDRSTRSISSRFSSCLSTNFATNSSSLSSSLMTASGRSSSSSLSYNSRPSLSKAVGNNDMQGKLGKGRHGFNIGVCCFLLMSLLVLVIWGKVCAIFCTSIVLVFANRWIKSIKRGPLENIVVDNRLPDIDSKLYKKKIIMEGLLERNHSRNLYR